MGVFDHPFMPEHMHDISVGNGFTTINVAKTGTSGKIRNVSYGVVERHLKNHLKICISPQGLALQALAIYTVHIIPGRFPTRKRVSRLPALARIGEIVALIPTMETFQYQWTGQGYGWAPA